MEVQEVQRDLPKLPFSRLKFPLSQVTEVGIPFHIRLLNEQSERLELLKSRPLELRSEQLKASNTVKLLKQDLFELENLNRQVREEDEELFRRTVEKPLREAVEVLSDFMYVHSDVLGPLLDIDNSCPGQLEEEFPGVICDRSRPHEEDGEGDQPGQSTQLQLAKVVETRTTADAWSYLKRELVEIHGLIRQFSTLVFGQQAQVDTIEANILQARENVREGTGHLKRASLLKAASFPIAGALLGGVILGPIGAFVGLKLFGISGCVAGGSVIGYTAGTRWKKRRQDAIEGVELKALTYPKSISMSTPDLSADSDKTK